MALGTITIASRVQAGDLKVLRLSFAGDSTYLAGGTADFTALVEAALDTAAAAAVDANVRGHEDLTILDVLGGVGGDCVLRYDLTNDKLLVIDGDPMTEIAPGDLSGTTFVCTVLAK
jgi:hypothetical protein